MSDRTVEFWRDISGKYDDAIDTILGENVRSNILEVLENESDMGETVEFGCGTGYFSKILSEKSQNLIATDISPEMLEIARKYLKGIDNVELDNVNCEFCPYETDTFDTVFIGLVLLFTDEAQRVLVESSRILKPDGTLFIAEPDISHLSVYGKFKFLYRTIKSYGRFPPASHFFSGEELKDMLENNGFNIVEHELLRDPSNSHSLSANFIKSKPLKRNFYHLCPVHK